MHASARRRHCHPEKVRRLPEAGLALRAPIWLLLLGHAALAVYLVDSPHARPALVRGVRRVPPHGYLQDLSLRWPRFLSPASHAEAPLVRAGARAYGADPPRTAHRFNGQGKLQRLLESPASALTPDDRFARKLHRRGILAPAVLQAHEPWWRRSVHSSSARSTTCRLTSSRLS
jgi:hypothetical protein